MKYPDDFLNKIICGDCLNVMKDIPDESIDLIVTSPPYYNAKEYSYFDDYQEYLDFEFDMLVECHRILNSTGRICLNVLDGYNRNPWMPIYADHIKMMQKLKFILRGSIVWNKGTSAGKTSWGSWKSSSNPCLIDEHEMIIVAHKNIPRINGSSIKKDIFMSCTHSVWNIKPQTKRNHPAPYPLDIPLRLVTFYSSERGIILDPFIGSGTTAIACINTNRNFIGIDISEEYCRLARERLGDK